MDNVNLMEYWINSANRDYETMKIKPINREIMER